jgi:hypothetical protein
MNGYWPQHGPRESRLMALGGVLMWGVVPAVGRAIAARTIAQRQATLEAICTRYGVPMVPYASVAGYAGEFGELIEGPGIVA